MKERVLIVILWSFIQITIEYAGTFKFEDTYDRKKVFNFNVIYKGLLKEEIIPRQFKEVQNFNWYSLKQVYALAQSGVIKITLILLKTLKVIK